MENQNKKSLKWLWITVALVIVGALAGWCVLNAINHPANNKAGAESVLNFSNTFVLFVIAFLVLALGYLLGAISIKGITLGTAGVFLVAILVGFLCTLIPKDAVLFKAFYLYDGHKVVSFLNGPIQNIGLIFFVGAVGFIAGPNFFKDLVKNFKTYILLGFIIILVGTLVAVACILLSGYSPEFWSGVLSGALTSTPGFSAAQDAATTASEFYKEITLGHAIAYPFGVIGVVLFVQIMPKMLKADMEKERQLLLVGVEEEERFKGKKLFEIEPFGFAAFGIAIVCGLLLGSIKIPLTGNGYTGACFSLGTTGGVLIMCLVFGHFGKIGKLSFQIPMATLKVLKELGLALFLLGAGVDGGVALVEQISQYGAGIVAWGFIGGAVMTVAPLIVGFILAKYLLKLPLLNNLGSITGGMTSTPALGTLINTAKTDNVASAYASTYPIALVLIVLASQLLILIF